VGLTSGVAPSASRTHTLRADSEQTDDLHEVIGLDLPDFYATVAADMLRFCEPREGVWIDLGCGDGPVASALARTAKLSKFILVDPSMEALRRAQARIRGLGVAHRLLPVRGKAESLPFPSGSIDFVVSRGSIFFWEDQEAGLREIHRVLGDHGWAMVGGGLGSRYPPWARREFIRRQREGQRKKGPRSMEAFRRVRNPETFRKWATNAGLHDFQVVGEGGLAESDPQTGVGIWLIFRK